MKTFKSNTAKGVRNDTLDGKDILVVPVVMIVDGVLNGALVTQEEYGRYTDAWNGRPVPVLHPEERGKPITASRPDIVEKRIIGHIYNAHAESGKLKAEAWLDVEKADRLGYGDLIKQIEAGEIIEVSTGYYSDAVDESGEYNGHEYTEVHVNIRPDHLALLPGEIGACSVADGCGTRVNQKKGFTMKVNEAVTVIAKALGLKTNCECKESEMDLIKQAKALVANGKLSAKQLEALQELDEEQRTLVKAIVDALPAAQAEEVVEVIEDEVTDMEDDEPEANEDDEPKQNKAKKPDLQKLVANAVKEELRREKVTERLVANEKNPFSEDELKAMPITHLEKLEKSIRPADYSGQGGFATNSDAFDSNVQPLTVNRGVLAKKESK